MHTINMDEVGKNFLIVLNKNIFTDLMGLI